MSKFRKITAVVEYSEGSDVTIMVLDYDDPINTLKVLNRDPYYLSEMIIGHAEEIEDLSEFDPCEYLEENEWYQSGYDMDTDCSAEEEEITEEEFNNPPDKWKRARVETKIVYGDDDEDDED
jgi:hypothetical protein